MHVHTVKQALIIMVVLPQPFGAQFAKDKQWGSSNNGTLTFPIAFRTIYSVAIGMQSWNSSTTYENYPWFVKSTTKLTVPTYNSAYTFYIAVGK